MPNLIRIMIQVPGELKEQLDGLKQRGYTTIGLNRAVLDRELRKPDIQPPGDNTTKPRKGRR